MTIKRESARAILITSENKICLIKRIKNGEEYWVTPGGGIETAETPKEALLRELKEEVGASVSKEKCIFAFEYTTNGQKQHFFVCYEDGDRSIPDGEEHKLNDPNNIYQIIDLSIHEVKAINLQPIKKRKEILHHIEEAINSRYNVSKVENHD